MTGRRIRRFPQYTTAELELIRAEPTDNLSPGKLDAIAAEIAARRDAPGRAAYESDLAARPTYHDGTPRRTWQQLTEFCRQTWLPSRDPN